ncbi:MAG TPA: CcdB family protein [Bauldia sp.]|nr:CcdB family protein [Bauldia sp.]
MVGPRQFDVHHIGSSRSGDAVDLAVILQDDALSDLPTRIAAPVIAVDERYDLDRLTVPVTIDGVRYIVAIHLLATLPVRAIGRKFAEIGEHERKIKSALDLLFFGV